MANSAFPASPTVGDRHRVDPSGPLREWTGNVWKLVRPSVHRQNVSGAATVNVASRDAVELAMTGNLTSVAFTGWQADSSLLQQVRIIVKQDNVGGKTFAWNGVAGVWLESPPDVSALSLTKNDTVLEFRATTIDGGATVKLEPIGVEYTMPCLFAVCDEFDVPAASAGGSVIINHTLSIVGSVELIDQTTGRRVSANWWQTASVPSNPIRIDFAAAHTAGRYKVRIVGQQLNSCNLEASASQWDTLEFSAVNAATLKATVSWVGPADGVEWDWGDGVVQTPSSNVELSHAYAPNYSGTVKLRWRKGTAITKLDLRGIAAWRLVADVSDLPPDLTILNTASTGTAITGSVSDLPRRLTSLSMTSNTNTAITGPASDLPRSLTAIGLNGTKSAITGPASDLPTGLTVMSLVSTTSAIAGATTTLPTGLTLLQLAATDSAISGPVSGLPAGLSTLSLSNTLSTMTGATADLPVGMVSLTVQSSNVAISGPAASLPTGMTVLNVGASPSVLSGSIADYPTGLLQLGISATASTVSWPSAGLLQSINALLELNLAAGGTGLTAADVNRALVDMVNANRTPTGVRIINVGGVRNAPPDSTSGGLDGVAAIATLVGRGWTVTTR